MTNRALVLGALSSGSSTWRAPLRARDSELMAAGLRAMGQSPEDALDDLRAAIADRYRDLDGRGANRTPSAAEELAALQQYVIPR